jgi:16S rRNA U516 pseudouridylate synthase RsuA-like enzyme
LSGKFSLAILSFRKRRKFATNVGGGKTEDKLDEMRDKWDNSIDVAKSPFLVYNKPKSEICQKSGRGRRLFRLIPNLNRNQEMVF